MRKNMYNDKILMIEIRELLFLTQYEVLYQSTNKEILNRVKKYFDLLKNSENLEGDNIDYHREIGILLDDEINMGIEKKLGEYCSEYYITLSDIQNSFLCCVATQSGIEICDTIQHIFINKLEATYGEIESQYGKDVLEYILAHKNYDYIHGVNPVVENDKSVLLFHGGTLEEMKILRNEASNVKRS